MQLPILEKNIRINLVPTFIKIDRTPSDDLLSIKDFVRNENKNWKVLSRQLRLLSNFFDKYLFAVNYPYLHASGCRMTKQAASALNQLYDSKASCFSHVKAFRDRASDNLGCCPYCGLPSNITLDHYLPKSIGAFPEYSVLSLNLVPACTPCQTKKSNFFSKVTTRHYLRNNRVGRIGSQKQAESPYCVRSVRGGGKFQYRRSQANKQPLRFIHPYFDDFILRPVTAISFSGRDGELVKLIAKGKICRWERMTINFHIAKLNVSYRAGHAIRRYRDSIISDFRSRSITSIVDAKAELRHLYKSALKRAGGALNSIEAVYIQSLLAEPEVVGKLLEASLVPPPLNVVAFEGISI